MIYTHLAVGLLGAALAFGGAWKVQDWRYGAIEAKRLSALAEAEKKRDKGSYEAATTFEKGRTDVETKFVTITETVEKIVDRPVYRDTVCLDPDGLRALRDAAAQTAAPESGGTLPPSR